DGVLLKIIDRVGHTYSAWLQEFARSDPDLADGGERLRQKGDSSSRLNGDEKSPGERLLSKLPERVIRGGRVCEVRGAIAQRLGVTPGVSSAALRSTSAPASRGLRSAFTEVSLLEAAREASAPVARLQVKLEGGQKVLLRMEPSATIGDLWIALEKWRAANGVARAGHGHPDGVYRPCSLRTAFPPRAYGDRGLSLEVVGLLSFSVAVSVARTRTLGGFRRFSASCVNVISSRALTG
ncbi:unnamed protein product, partial [Polarella glacialis]